MSAGRNPVRFAVLILVLIVLLVALTPLLPRAYADVTTAGSSSALLEKSASASTLYLPMLMKGGSGPSPSATNTPTSQPTSGGLFMNKTNTTVSPKVAIDASGGIHMAYNAYNDVNGTSPAYYAYCAANCGTSTSWSIVSFGNKVQNTELVLTKTGHPRLLLFGYGPTYDTNALTYAACDAGCTTIAGWKLIQAASSTDTDLTLYDRSHFTFALDNLNRPRFVFQETLYGGLGYAYCDASDCTANGSWSVVQLFPNTFAFSGLSLAFTSDGKPRLATVIFQTGVSPSPLYYGGCDSACNQGANWTLNPLFIGDGAEFVLRLDSQNHPRLALYQSGTGLLFYAICDTGCSNVANWSSTDIGLAASKARLPDLALDVQGRPRIAYRDEANDGLGYAWCNANCATASTSWQHTLAESSSILAAQFNPPIPANCSESYWYGGYRPSLALNSVGNPRVGHEAKQLRGGGTCTTAQNYIAVRFTFFNSP